MNYLNTNLNYLKFEKVLKSEIYVDKSLLIEKLNKIIGTNDCNICITRPRRFGKTINANMLGAYYTKGFNSHELFDNLKIAKSPLYEAHRNRHNVIYIDFSRMPELCSNYREYISDIYEGLISDLEEYYPSLKGKKFSSLDRYLNATNESFVFILDEWDSILYKDFMSADDKQAYLGFLKRLLKDQVYVELAYMTGVLPIAKYSSGSELNMFKEYNFMNDSIYENYFGFSEKEVKELCDIYTNISYKELKKWYDGYYMSDGSSLFNPRSVNFALTDGVYKNYWTETGPMNEIAEYIEHNVEEVREDIVKMVSNIAVEIDLMGYSAAELQLDTRDEILSAMVVYGFLSYHDGYLRIPNYELMEKFQRVLSRDSMNEIKEIVNYSKEMLEATLACDEKKVAEILEYVHEKEIPFLQYNDENSLSCIITLCYLYARNSYDIKREEKSGKGYCDYMFIPKKDGKPVIIIELKYDKSAKNAIQQIKSKNYIQEVRYYDEILLVGINYDKKIKKHTCIIEKIKK